MQRFSNITGQARHGLERTGLVSRSSTADSQTPPQPPAQQPQQLHHQIQQPLQQVHQPSLPSHPPANHASTSQHRLPLSTQPHPLTSQYQGSANVKRAVNGHPQPVDTFINLSFNVPFSSALLGPKPQGILHGSPQAVERWTFPLGAEEGIAAHKLPVHQGNIEQLRRLCRGMSENSQGRIEATVMSSLPKPLPALQRRPLEGLVTNVCLSGDAEVVYKLKTKILTETPIVLKTSHVDIDTHLVIQQDLCGVRVEVLDHLDVIAKYTGTDIFLLNPKAQEVDAAPTSYGKSADMQFDQRLRVAVFGDPESVEHAKTRVMIMIDQILQRHVDILRLELSLHTVICGRTRNNVRQIEATSDTAIYFPPPFPRIYGYLPQGAHRRGEDEIYITGATKESVNKAKQKIHDLVINTKCYVKDVLVSAAKIDSILLNRLDKVRKIMEVNGSYVLFPQLGSQRGLIRVQATEILLVEKTIREVMSLAGQFYSASWWLDPAIASMNMRSPSPADIRIMLSDICTSSGAETGFERLTFSISGSDDSVKAAMMVIHEIPFVKRASSQIRVKIELANEHKEFVSGKKNGKINKIMGQSNVQIIFDGFNEYNFYIDVCSAQYEATKSGLELVEQEMPAAISFHVPDQYHKRIIGIGGQQIQRIMKRYSVFVKFSNAMERGNVGQRDEDDVKVDNVVKQDIMDMIEKVDAEIVSENVVVNRLCHRQLIARLDEVHELERKWKCRVQFPPTESASDVVVISGPEYQVPQAVDDFLGMIHESHEIIVPVTFALSDYLHSDAFDVEVRQHLKLQYEIDLRIESPKAGTQSRRDDTDNQELSLSAGTIDSRFLLEYTRNNAGGLKDAIDFLVSSLATYGLDADMMKGAITRPKSDTFETSLQFFDSKLLQTAGTPVLGAVESPTRLSFGHSAESSISLNSIGKSGNQLAAEPGPDDRVSLFGKIRKPGSISSISNFILDRRSRNQNHNQVHSTPPPAGGRSSSIFFKQAFNSSNHPYSQPYSSSNASRASLVSMESRDSGYRNPWNDSGISVNLPEDEELSSSAFTTSKSSANQHASSGWGNGSKTAFFGTGKAANRSTGSLASLSSINAPHASTVSPFAAQSGALIGPDPSQLSSSSYRSRSSSFVLGTPPIGTSNGATSIIHSGDMTPRHIHTSKSSISGDYRPAMATSGHVSAAGSSLSLDHMIGSFPLSASISNTSVARPSTSHSINSIQSGLSFSMGYPNNNHNSSATPPAMYPGSSFNPQKHTHSPAHSLANAPHVGVIGEPAAPK